jgi:hypothetical protein
LCNKVTGWKATEKHHSEQQLQQSAVGSSAGVCRTDIPVTHNNTIIVEKELTYNKGRGGGSIKDASYFYRSKTADGCARLLFTHFWKGTEKANRKLALEYGGNYPTWKIISGDTWEGSLDSGVGRDGLTVGQVATPSPQLWDLALFQRGLRGLETELPRYFGHVLFALVRCRYLPGLQTHGHFDLGIRSRGMLHLALRLLEVIPY